MVEESKVSPNALRGNGREGKQFNRNFNFIAKTNTLSMTLVLLYPFLCLQLQAASCLYFAISSGISMRQKVSPPRTSMPAYVTFAAVAVAAFVSTF
jgi:hypothetical protein